MARLPVANLNKHKNLLTVAAVLIVLYVLLPQLGSFQDSLTLIKHLRVDLLAPAILFALATYAAAAATYCLLAFHPLRYVRTLAIELAGMFLNRLVPAGLGSIGVNYRYLRKNNHTGVEAGSVVAVNNTIGIVGHLFLLTGLLMTTKLPTIKLGSQRGDAYLLLASLVVLLLLLVGLRFQKAWQEPVKRFFMQITMYRRRPTRLMLALFSSLTLTMSNVLALLLVVQAFGLEINFLTALVVFTFGIILGTATPTPGGLGGIEAGLVTGLVAYHFTGAQALAIVLAYRLITYWLPILIGAATFLFVQRRGYI